MALKHSFRRDIYLVVFYHEFTRKDVALLDIIDYQDKNQEIWKPCTNTNLFIDMYFFCGLHVSWFHCLTMSTPFNKTKH